MVSGEIDFVNHRKNINITMDKIISSCILTRYVPDKGIVINLVIQFNNNIVVFNL